MELWIFLIPTTQSLPNCLTSVNRITVYPDTEAQSLELTCSPLTGSPL